MIWKFFLTNYIEFIVVVEEIDIVHQPTLVIKYYTRDVPAGTWSPTYRKGTYTVDKVVHNMSGWTFPPVNSSFLDLLVVTGLSIENMQWYWGSLIKLPQNRIK
jgi:hypothetical protein